MRKSNRAWDRWRKVHPTWGRSEGDYGYFEVRGLRIISSGHDETTKWEHVSVSRADGRIPSWEDMCFVKDMFWGETETVLQFHTPKSEYVNYHDACLHLWKPIGENVITPPMGLVGPMTAGT